MMRINDGSGYLHDDRLGLESPQSVNWPARLFAFIANGRCRGTADAIQADSKRQDWAVLEGQPQRQVPQNTQRGNDRILPIAGM